MSLTFKQVQDSMNPLPGTEVPPDGWAVFDAFGCYVEGTFSTNEVTARAKGCMKMDRMNEGTPYLMPEVTPENIDAGSPYRWLVRPVWLSTSVILWRDRK